MDLELSEDTLLSMLAGFGSCRGFFRTSDSPAFLLGSDGRYFMGNA